MEKKVTPERKIELARYIREENMGNRMKLRQRESILYGREMQAPLFEKGQLSAAEDFSMNNGRAWEGRAAGSASGSFRYRMVLAMLLFAAFLLCDTKDSRILSYSTDDIYDMITADSFHLYDGGGHTAAEDLSGLFE